jgi:hypothetical protein
MCAVHKLNLIGLQTRWSNPYMSTAQDIAETHMETYKALTYDSFVQD